MTPITATSELISDTSPMLSGKWQHIYGIIRTEDVLVFDVASVDQQEGVVLALPHTGLAAISSPTEHINYQAMPRQEVVRALLAHQHVVETVMREYPILPVKFGTVLPGPEWIERLLLQGGSRFREALDQIADHMQMEVVVSWDLNAIFPMISSEPAITQLKNEIATLTTEESTAKRIELGQLVQSSIENRRTTLRDELVPELSALAISAVINPPMDDTMVANVALLLDLDGQRRLDQCLEQLDAHYEGKLHFRCVGPLPPYSFATVHVQPAIFAEIDAARQLLGVEHITTPTTIKRAYYQQANQLHPDLHPDAADAEAQMNQLVQAYRLLTTYAASHIAHDAGILGCDLRRDVVERTLLITMQTHN